MKRGFSTFLLILALGLSLGAQARRIDEEALLGRRAAAGQGLFRALAQRDWATLVTLHDQGADPNASLSQLGLTAMEVFGEPQINTQPFDPSSWPLLHWAAALNQPEAVKILLRSGARINTPDIYGATALHWAAWSGGHSAAVILLQNNADGRAADHKRRTPRDWAIMRGQNELIRLLDGLDHGAAPSRDADRDGVTDDLDFCPDTLYGAPVDDRGCWVAARPDFFEPDKAAIKEKYLPHLAEAAQVLNTRPEVRVEIQGHTDSAGSAEYNLNLGQRRAETVAHILAENGVDPGRLEVTSQGESRPVVSRALTGDWARNRRVEIHTLPAPEQSFP